jgi:hypothetical protein
MLGIFRLPFFPSMADIPLVFSRLRLELIGKLVKHTYLGTILPSGKACALLRGMISTIPTAEIAVSFSMYHLIFNDKQKVDYKKA